jgi:hypothetical protein
LNVHCAFGISLKACLLQSKVPLATKIDRLITGFDLQLD